MDITRDMLIEDRKNMTVKEIANKYGCSVKSIAYKLQKYDLTKKVDRLDIKDEDILFDYNSGLSIREIACKYKCSHDTISKRLKKYNISNSRAEGIKRHFEQTYTDRWPLIKNDLDTGFSKTFIRSKYKIRMENLDKLLEANGYYYGSDAYIKRIENQIKYFSNCFSDNKKYKHILNYVVKLKEYYLFYGNIPTRKDFSKFINIAYNNVCLTVNKYNLNSFFATSTISDYEVMIKKILDDNKVKYIHRDRTILEGKELDFYLPDYKLGLEINPYFRHCTENGLDKYYHQKKAILAQSKGIGLINIYDSDFSKLDKLFSYILRKPLFKIGARECISVLISNKDANDFYKKYHLQSDLVLGNAKNVALLYRGEIVSVVSFGKSRYNTKYDYEILRYATHFNYIITGCFAKLLKSAQNYGINGNIITYVDLNKRLRSSNVYEFNGFKFSHTTEPSYFWVDSKGSILSRYQTQKKKLIELGYDKKKTEKEIMNDRGYYQVYDCGNMVYSINL